MRITRVGAHACSCVRIYVCTVGRVLTRGGAAEVCECRGGGSGGFGWLKGWMDGRTDGRIDGQMDTYADGWMKG